MKTYKTKEMKLTLTSDNAVTIEWQTKDRVTHSIRLSIAQAQKMFDDGDMKDQSIVFKTESGFKVKIFLKEDN